MSPILVAGIGNIFKGDDGFGVAVAQRMAGRPLPAGVTVKDFGIRGLDLTYALLDGYAAVILVDTAQRGEPPGTVYVIEPEASAISQTPNLRICCCRRTSSIRPGYCGWPRRWAANADAWSWSPASPPVSAMTSGAPWN